MEEVFKNIIGYDGYQISNIGRVKSLNYRKKNIEGVRKNWFDTSGYYQTDMKKDGKKCCFKVHRLVAEAFIPNPENKPQVNHINGIKIDNHVNNLEWCTASENMYHAYDNDLKVNPKGENNYQAKFTNLQIIGIRERLNNGENQMNLVREFGVSKRCIGQIKFNKTYKNV